MFCTENKLVDSLFSVFFWQVLFFILLCRVNGNKKRTGNYCSLSATSNFPFPVYVPLK